MDMSVCCRSVMKSCSSAVCVLVLLIATGSESCFTSVKVKLHDSATLPCAGKCSGVAKWTVLQKPSEVLAECDQTSCRSVKAGYRMIHDQYRNGTFPLIITKAEFNTKTWYTCKCDDRNICDVDIETYRSDSCSTLVTVKLHDSATLHCIPRCSGVAKWTAHNSTEVLAECDQTSCRSVKEGYRTIHDQYLKGKFPLIITRADYSMKTRYTCKCDGDDICDADVETYHDRTGSGAVLPVWGTVLIVVLSLFVIVG